MDESAAAFLNFLESTPAPARFVLKCSFFVRGGLS